MRLKMIVLALLLTIPTVTFAGGHRLERRVDKLLKDMRSTVTMFRQEPDFNLVDKIQSASNPMSYKNEVFKRLYHYGMIHNALKIMVSSDYITDNIGYKSRGALSTKLKAFDKLSDDVNLLYGLLDRLPNNMRRKTLIKLAYL